MKKEWFDIVKNKLFVQSVWSNSGLCPRQRNTNEDDSTLENIFAFNVVIKTFIPNVFFSGGKGGGRVLPVVEFYMGTELKC